MPPTFFYMDLRASPFLYEPEIQQSRFCVQMLDGAQNSVSLSSA